MSTMIPSGSVAKPSPCIPGTDPLASQVPIPFVLCGPIHDSRIMNVEISNEVYINKPTPWGYLQFTSSCMELDSFLA
jgi:hypothetical protein